jgi:hypothetical protein
MKKILQDTLPGPRTAIDLRTERRQRSWLNAVGGEPGTFSKTFAADFGLIWGIRESLSDERLAF